MRYLLFYKPPCGSWYVHSHKLYDTPEQARDSAKRFLHPDTEIAVHGISESVLDRYATAVSMGAES